MATNGQSNDMNSFNVSDEYAHIIEDNKNIILVTFWENNLPIDPPQSHSNSIENVNRMNNTFPQQQQNIDINIGNGSHDPVSHTEAIRGINTSCLRRKDW